MQKQEQLNQKVAELEKEIKFEKEQLQIKSYLKATRNPRIEFDLKLIQLLIGYLYGINEKISQEQWQEIVDSVTSGIRKKRQAEAICEAVTRIGSILKECYPYEKDDRDELHNLIIN